MGLPSIFPCRPGLLAALSLSGCRHRPTQEPLPASGRLGPGQLSQLLLPSLLSSPKRTSTTLQAGSRRTGWGSQDSGSPSPLSGPCPPRAYLRPYPTAYTPSRGSLGWSQLSDLGEGVPGPLHLLLSGLPLGFLILVTSSLSPMSWLYFG